MPLDAAGRHIGPADDYPFARLVDESITELEPPALYECLRQLLRVPERCA